MEKDLLMDLSFDLRPTMIDQLKAETSADDEELMIFLGIGTARAVEFAARDDDPVVLKRAVVMRDAVRRLFIEKENYRK